VAVWHCVCGGGCVGLCGIVCVAGGVWGAVALCVQPWVCVALEDCVCGSGWV
jgi:hypothetical protein